MSAPEGEIDARLWGPCPHGVNRMIYVCPKCARDDADMAERKLMRATLDRAMDILDRLEKKL